MELQLRQVITAGPRPGGVANNGPAQYDGVGGGDALALEFALLFPGPADPTQGEQDI